MNAANMVLTWGPKCDFIFLTWATDEWPAFIGGVILSFLAAFITTFYSPVLRKQIKLKAANKLHLTLGYLVEYLLKLFIMLLMMTMNAWVCLAIALGMALGCTVFGIFGERIRKRLFQATLI